ncbi:MAG: sulfite exporter TauE/SafE family protein [Pseudomonadota bacterium]
MPFDVDQPVVLAGLLLGLASSLHCLGMCGGIAASLSFAAPGGPSLRSLLAPTLLINAGRITGYVVAGALVGGLGTQMFGALDRSLAHVALRWAAAVSLGLIGLSLLGALPLPDPLLRLGAVISRAIQRLSTGLPAHRAGLFVAGCVWGFFPCAMVYAALFYAMLAGSALHGALVMLGFGLGTLAPVMGAGLGLPWLRAQARSPRLQTLMGCAILALGILSTVPPEALPAWCRFG